MSVGGLPRPTERRDLPMAGDKRANPPSLIRSRRRLAATVALTCCALAPACVPAAAAIPTPLTRTPTHSWPAARTLTVAIPALAIPALTTPVIATPVIRTPVIVMPAVKIPTVTTPSVTVPPVTTPVIVTPAVRVPALKTPPITIPRVTTPTVTVTLPAVTTPTARTPTPTARTPTPTARTPTVTTPDGNDVDDSGSEDHSGGVHGNEALSGGASRRGTSPGAHRPLAACRAGSSACLPPPPPRRRREASSPGRVLPRCGRSRGRDPVHERARCACEACAENGA